MSDFLAPLPVAQVAGWYRRLADRIAQERVGVNEPLSSIFLRHWLDNRDPRSTFRFVPPAHLQSSSFVFEVLRYHRAVFLTQQPARTASGQRWAGLLPRLQGSPGFTRWSGAGALLLDYESLVEIGAGLTGIVRIQQFGTAEERDLATSLRGFQLRSRVTVQGTVVSSSRILISFSAWRCRARDRYDWNYSEHFTVPNPDYGSSHRDAVRPRDQRLTVYHSNALRLEQAQLAAPYDVESEEWSVVDARVTQPAEIDPRRRYQ